ncbi:hypothetical protein NDU88_002928 [Pleurodeles waltl]|uniref:Uncharacterized protein n=1 Tax=Pleurodeles waltl TaxID=8319 RepID=A0AAV7W3T0_PLEWA|nr:hypothetical protein NDU88_002928 [Pleurodeles waltl]
MGRTKGKHADGIDALASGDPAPATTMDAPVDELDVILQEIRESRLAIEQRLGSITLELSILKADLKKLMDRMKQTETSVTSILPDHKKRKNAIEHLQQPLQEII